MTDRAVDPFEAAREFALALSAVAPEVPTIELPFGRLASAALARFRLGQVATQGWVPSMALVGRRGVGKSTLALDLADFGSTGEDLAASCAQVSWGGSLLAFDTPGLRSAGRPQLRDRLCDALADDPPALMVAVFSATEVDAGIDDDVADLTALSRGWTQRRSPPPALLAVLHRVDELPPVDHEPVADDPERAVAIATATRVLRARLSPLDGGAPIVATFARRGAIDPIGRRELTDQARSMLAQRLGSAGDRASAFERCLSRLVARDDPAASSRLRRQWIALNAQARAIVLHPRGWAPRMGGRSEPG